MANLRFIPIGTKYNRLTTTSLPFKKHSSHNNNHTYLYVTVKCECGTIKDVTLGSLRNNGTRSCGCIARDNSTAHVMWEHPIYNIWNGIKYRCLDTANKYYGGRGISICDEWFNSFDTFYNWSMSNGWVKGLAIDRKDNDGNYEPNNCRWVTQKENNRNQSTTKLTMQRAKHIRLLLKYKTVREMARLYQVSEGVIYGVKFNKTWN